MNKDKIREKAVQFQIIQQRLRGMEQKSHMLLSGIEELERARLALEDLERAKGEAYIPLGASNFVFGEVKDNQNVLISIGSGIAVKRKREDAIKIAEERIDEFKRESDKVTKAIDEMSNELMTLQTDLETLRK